MTSTYPRCCYVKDQDLGYRAIRKSYSKGECLTLDDSYRLAHLPLVAPLHPDAMHRAPDGRYVDGRYDQPRFSLVIPIDADLLENSPALRDLNAAIAARSWSRKIAWPVMRQRRHRLHITLCGGLAFDELGSVADNVQSCLQRIGPVHVRIGGPLIGAKNIGRVYFATYPEQRAQGNAFHLLQRAIGRPPTDLYLLGYYNLTDHLSVAETAEFGAIIAHAALHELMTCEARHVWIMRTNDDLALSSTVHTDIVRTTAGWAIPRGL